MSHINIGHDKRFDLASHNNGEDLLKFGMIPEFIGRLPVTTILEPLSEDDLVRVLVEPKNAMMRQYQKLMASAARRTATATG